MKFLNLLLTALLLLLLEGCMGLFLSKEPEGFVTVKGSQLIYNEKPYFFAGANLW